MLPRNRPQLYGFKVVVGPERGGNHADRNVTQIGLIAELTLAGLPLAAIVPVELRPCALPDLQRHLLGCDYCRILGDLWRQRVANALDDECWTEAVIEVAVFVLNAPGFRRGTHLCPLVPPAPTDLWVVNLPAEWVLDPVYLPRVCRSPHQGGVGRGPSAARVVVAVLVGGSRAL